MTIAGNTGNGLSVMVFECYNKIRYYIRDKHCAGLALGCFVFWLALARDISAGSLIAAAVMSLTAAQFAGRPFRGAQGERFGRLLLRPDLLALLTALLMVQSYMAAFAFIARMLSGRYQPGVVRIRTRLESPLGRAMLANMISLVPGTLSLWMEDRNIYVHWFNIKTTHGTRAGDLMKRPIERLLARLLG